MVLGNYKESLDKYSYLMFNLKKEINIVTLFSNILYFFSFEDDH